MESTEVLLHPNWRALATVHLPLKRFVPAGAATAEKGVVDLSNEKYEIQSGSGLQVKAFYEQVLKTTESPKPVASKQAILQGKLYKRPNTKCRFDARKFFDYAVSNNIEALKNMRVSGSDVNTRDDFGWTALMMAACEGATTVVQYLLEMDADREVRDKSGYSAADLARKKDMWQIVNLLENTTNPPRLTQTVEVQSTKSIVSTFYCEACKQTFSETSESEHQTSTIHKFNVKSELSALSLQKFHISERNRGLQLMLKQGWDRQSGLGPSQSGQLYPIKTIIRKQRSGLGIEQTAARVTHYAAFDTRATQRQAYQKPRTRNDMRREKIRDWKRQRRLRRELS